MLIVDKRYTRALVERQGPDFKCFLRCLELNAGGRPTRNHSGKGVPESRVFGNFPLLNQNKAEVQNPFGGNNRRVSWI
jgi:hypothetical protein